MIYFDNNATTQIAPKVFEAMRPFLETEYWNPSSAYDRGKETAKVVETARENVAALLGSANADEIAFTSGGTESDNWAILGALEANPEKDHIVTTRVEHDAVRKLCEKLEKQGKRVTWLDVDEDGSLDLDTLRAALDERTAVVSVMLANNETGILFPVEEIAEIVKERSDALFHVDGVNAVGKIAIDLRSTEIDLFSVSAHKFHGPKGVGALYIRNGVELPSMYFGGGQENGRRAGTEAVHQIAGIGAAAEFVRDLSPMKAIAEMRDRLESSILATIPDAFLNGTADTSNRLPNTSYISFANTNGEAILAMLDEAGICVSTGSACNSQDHTPSAVLQAMNVPYVRAMGAIRFSLGRNNTAAEAETVIEVLPGIIERLRKLGN
ncbi:MAG TPA: aminotransferase class V-fold PLP-dependent enzyme [Pyrinomonadaceae bacterium]|nr:aminotransferase class V-fold PLP-dependent enzyme [Pyrinomonadaceae bacterium]